MKKTSKRFQDSRTLGDELAMILDESEKLRKLCLFTWNFRIQDTIYLRWDTKDLLILLKPRRQLRCIS